MNIYQKLVEIRKCIDGFTKDTKGFNYSYVSGTQVLAKIYDKMNELGVILEPHIFHEKSSYEIFQYDTTDKYDKAKHHIDYIVNAPMEYVWINAEKPEDRSIIPWGMFGQQDEISKAFGSGLTYSERYFLMKYFNVPTDADDPDKKQPSSNNSVGSRQQSHSQEGKSTSLISEGQQKRLFALSNGNAELVKEILMKHNYTKSSEIKKSEYENICNEVIAKVTK